MHKITVHFDRVQKAIAVMAAADSSQFAKDPKEAYERLLHAISVKAGFEVDCHVVQKSKNLGEIDGKYELCEIVSCTNNRNCRAQLFVDKIVKLQTNNYSQIVV